MRRLSHTFLAQRNTFFFTTQYQSLEVLFNNLNNLTNHPTNAIPAISKNIQQLQAHIGNMKFDQLKHLATVANSFSLTDEGFATKSFQRTTELLLTNQIKITDSLSILDVLLTSKRQYSQSFYQKILNFLGAAVQQQELSPQQIAYCTLNYGIIVSTTETKVKEIEYNLTQHIKNKIDDFQSNDLRLIALGLSLGQFVSTSLFDMIDRQVTNVKMIYEDLARIGTAYAMIDGGSVELWKLIEEQTILHIHEQSPSVMAMTIIFYKQTPHGKAEIYDAIEKAFLARYHEFNIHEKVLMFSGFGKVEQESSQIWEYMESEVDQLLEFTDMNTVVMMICDCLSVVGYLSSDTVQKFINHIILNGSTMNEHIKNNIYDKLQDEGLLTEELEQILLKRY